MRSSKLGCCLFSRLTGTEFTEPYPGSCIGRDSADCVCSKVTGKQPQLSCMRTKPDTFVWTASPYHRLILNPGLPVGMFTGSMTEKASRIIHRQSFGWLRTLMFFISSITKTWTTRNDLSKDLECIVLPWLNYKNSHGIRVWGLGCNWVLFNSLTEKQRNNHFFYLWQEK